MNEIAILEYVLVFLLWNMMIYWMHRIIHMVHIPYVTDFHWDHHRVITLEQHLGLHWSNLFLFNDTWKSTADLWCSEIIPTLMFCYFTGHWWVFIFYYLWAAFIQEGIEHNKDFDLYPLSTSGKWHLVHHSNSSYNYGIFLPIWDMMFGTYKRHE